jgi:2-haloacid dehalogenase
MRTSRRSFVRLLAAGTLSGCAAGRAPGRAAGGAARPIRAVAFDGLVLLDPRPVLARAREAAGPRGDALVEAWRASLFAYQWLRALGRRPASFEAISLDALRFAARKVGVDLPASRAEALAAGFRDLRPWPDVPGGLEALRARGLRLAVLSNMSQAMLRDGLERGGVAGAFEHVLSTDAVRSFKPDPAAYRLGAAALGLGPDEVAFAAFAGWDVAGASWFGYPTVWVNRLSAPPDELGVTAAHVGPDLAAVAAFLSARAGARGP